MRLRHTMRTLGVWAVMLLAVTGCGDGGAIMPPSSDLTRSLGVPVEVSSADPAVAPTDVQINWTIPPAKLTAYSPDGQGGPAPTPIDNFIAVTVQVRGYCYAGSRIVDSQALGGFGPSDNFPQKVAAGCAGTGCYLLAQPDYLWRLEKSACMRLLLVNRTGHLLQFAACDSRLAIVQEARDIDGLWKPIEYLPESGCGNSYHRVFLPAGEYWSFPVARYRGEFATRLRFRLDLGNGPALISNEFDGSINRSQFGKKEGHQPTDLMDPYTE